MSQRQLRWPIEVHAGLFTVGMVVGSLIFLILDAARKASGGLPRPNAHAIEHLARYGIEGLVVGHLTTGALSFALGAAICKRVLPEPTRWSSAAAGAIYAAVLYAWLFFGPNSPGSLSGRLFVGFLFLAPAVAVVVLPFVSRRSKSGVQPAPGSGRG